MSADEAIEVTACREVDILPPGEAENIGEALDRALACPGEGDRVGAPVHLALDSWTCFKPDDWFLMGPYVREPLAQYRDTAVKARFHKLLMEPHGRDFRVVLHNLL